MIFDVMKKKFLEENILLLWFYYTLLDFFSYFKVKSKTDHEIISKYPIFHFLRFCMWFSMAL